MLSGFYKAVTRNPESKALSMHRRKSKQIITKLFARPIDIKSSIAHLWGHSCPATTKIPIKTVQNLDECQFSEGKAHKTQCIRGAPIIFKLMMWGVDRENQTR